HCPLRSFDIDGKPIAIDGYIEVGSTKLALQVGFFIGETVIVNRTDDLFGDNFVLHAGNQSSGGIHKIINLTGAVKVLERFTHEVKKFPGGDIGMFVTNIAETMVEINQPSFLAEYCLAVAAATIGF